MRKIITNGLYVLLLVFTCSMYATQQKTINGKVTDQAGIALVGATIVVKGTAKGTSTDFDGNYSITVNESDILNISYIGYIDQDIAVAGKTIINISLEEDTSVLDEVIVVGYGTQKKENVTGAISNVKVGDILQNRPNTNILSALQGVVPGMQITTNSGEPGSLGLTANIRGFTSINGGAPLFLLDNVEIAVGDINPQDIESVTVLKDVAASSIYGARAAFGVVLLTTKKGKKNTNAKFSYSLTTSISSPEDLPEKASTFDFINALNDWGLQNYWTGQDIPTWVGFLDEYKANPSAYPNGIATDTNDLDYALVDQDLWGTLFSDNAFSQIHNLSITGGSEKISYRVSSGYSEENGIIITNNDRYKKYNINANLNVDISDKLSSTTNLFYVRTNRTTALSSFSRTVNYPTWVAIDGNHVFQDGTEIPYNTAINFEKLRTPPQRFENNFRVYQQLKYEVVKDLNVIGEYTFERKTTDFYSNDPKLTTVNPTSFEVIGVDPATSFYQRTNEKNNYITLNGYVNYTKSIKNHNFKAVAGFNREERKIEQFTARKENLTNLDLPSLSQATGTATVDDRFAEWAVIGYFGRLNYNFNEKYFLEGNIRLDGSSRFPSEDKFSSFTSFSAGWNVMKESFMKNVDFIDIFKLRASYGELGNQNNNVNNRFDVYPSIGQFTGSSIGWIDPNTGLRAFTINTPNRLISPSFTWERVETTNFGLDTRFFNNKLSASFDIFTRNTLDMLTSSAELPAVLGTGEPLGNSADLQTKGWEVEIKWQHKINDFSYNLGVSISDSESEITKFDNEEGLLSQYYVGRKIGEIWGYTTDGFYTVDDFVDGSLNAGLTGGTLKEGIPAFKGVSQNPGDVKYKDLNGDGEIFSGNSTLGDSGDLSVIGNSQRRYQYGVFGNMTYKNFDLAFLFNGVGKRDVWQNNPIRFPYVGEFNVMFAHQLDYWTPDNTNAFFPRNYPRGAVNYGNSRRVQTKYLLNGAYLRLKNLTIGYNIPKDVLNKVGIDKIRLFASAENLFTIDDLPKGINTELRNKGNGATYPFSRSFSVGLNLQF